MTRAFGRRTTVGAAALLLAATIAVAAEQVKENVSPLFGVRLPARYRRWQVVSVAHEAGALNDIRVILGNDVAIKSLRGGRRIFPDGAKLARVAWKLVPSERNNAVFGRSQSFVAGDPTNVQIAVKDSRRYAATGGWGYGQFEQGKANPDAALMETCFGCHRKLPETDDFVFTRYSR